MKVGVVEGREGTGRIGEEGSVKGRAWEGRGGRGWGGKRWGEPGGGGASIKSMTGPSPHSISLVKGCSTMMITPERSVTTTEKKRLKYAHEVPPSAVT